MDLVDMYRGELTVRKTSVLVLNLPRGCATWRAAGGRAAITEEVEAGWILERTMYAIAHQQGGSKGKSPEMREYPPGLEELSAKSQKAQSRAEAFRAKHLNKNKD